MILVASKLWNIKKQLGKSITNDKIDELYDYALKNGALGEKYLVLEEEDFYYCI